MKEKEINKLDQLSRIEYFLKKKEIDYSPCTYLIYTIKTILSVMAFCMIFDIFIKVVYGMPSGLTLNILSTGLFEFVFFLGVLAEVLNFLFWGYNQHKLDKEFFEFSFEIKPKEVKNGNKKGRS